MGDNVEILYRGRNGTFQGVFENGAMISPMVSVNFDEITGFSNAMSTFGRELGGSNASVLTMDKSFMALRISNNNSKIIVLITKKKYLKLEPVRDEILKLLEKINFQDGAQVSKVLQDIGKLLKSNLRELFQAKL